MLIGVFKLNLIGSRQAILGLLIIDMGHVYFPKQSELSWRVGKRSESEESKR